MAMGVGGPGGNLKSDINVTPLVDVCLVLLIIFMVITPMLQRGKDVTLPKGHEDKVKKGVQEDPLILSVTKDKRMWLDKIDYDESHLKDALEKELTDVPGRRILLKGDNTLQVGDIRKVMAVAQKAHAKGVGLGIEALKEGE
jgi:biopolymer transport protein TolR